MSLNRMSHQVTGSFVKADNTFIKVGIEKKLFFCQGRETMELITRSSCVLAKCEGV